jgi:hypothetical protein
MQRLREIEIGYAEHVRRLSDAYRALEDECGPDAELFERTWRARAETWRFDVLNELIRDHNAYFPIESNLPMDPRTQDYVRVRGASYRRRQLGPAWVLEHFPATAPARSAGRARPPRLPPREP